MSPRQKQPSVQWHHEPGATPPATQPRSHAALRTARMPCLRGFHVYLAGTLPHVPFGPAFSNVVKRIYDTVVPASSQKVSRSSQREPALPTPQANLCPDEATTGTSVTKRRASSLMFRDAFKSRSLTAPHCSHTHTRSS